MQTFHLFLLTHLGISDVISRNENNIVQKSEPVFEPENSDLSMGVGELTIYKQTAYVYILQTQTYERTAFATV